MTLQGKTFSPKPAHRKLVSLFCAGGMSEPAIARELGICQNTLRKHFAEELRASHDHERAANLQRLKRAADRGNVTAMKFLDVKFGTIAAAAAFIAPAPEAPKPPKLGKKDEAKAAATTAGDGTDWGSDLQLPGSLPN